MKYQRTKFLPGLIVGLVAAAVLCVWFTHVPLPWEKTAGPPVVTTNWLETREDQADKTVWAKEMLAEKCGRTLEDLWDSVNASSNKLETIAHFTVGEVILPKWGTVQHLPHGIELRKGIASGQRLLGSQWRNWIETFAKNGWQLDNLELRHSAFDTDTNGRPWKSRYYFAARLTRAAPPERAILEGNLTVNWGAISAREGSVPVGKLDAGQLSLKTREGAPFFKKIFEQTITPLDTAGLIDPLIVHDLDGDGLSEIILPANNKVFFRNGAQTYESRALCRYPVPFITTALIADFDGDGFADLLCANRRGLYLFKGSSGGSFDEQPRLVWDANPPLKNAIVMTCGDLFHSGRLDVFIAQYKVPLLGQVMRPHYYDANDGWPSYLLRNDGQGNFSDATESSGLGAKRWRRTYSACLADLDSDGNLDLAVISDFAGLDLYKGDGQGHFTDVTAKWVAEPHAFGMACALADFNGDGRLDLLMIGMPSPTVDRLQHMGLWRPYSTEDRERRPAMTFGNRLFLARSGGGFEQTSLSDSIARSGWSWGCSAFDFDNDGYPDVYIANGLETRQTVRDYESEFWLHNLFIDESIDDTSSSRFLIRRSADTRGSNWSYGGYEKNRLFLNLEGQSFIEIGHLGGVSLEQDSRNMVADDLDGDGKVDLVLTTQEVWPQVRQTLHVFANTLPDPGHWIGFRFRQEQNSKSPVGAELTLHYSGRRAVRHVVNGDSHRSQHSTTIHFGLGNTTEIDEAQIGWPDGTVITLSHPQTDRYNEVRPPSIIR